MVLMDSKQFEMSQKHQNYSYRTGSNSCLKPYSRFSWQHAKMLVIFASNNLGTVECFSIRMKMSCKPNMPVHSETGA